MIRSFSPVLGLGLWVSVLSAEPVTVYILDNGVRADHEVFEHVAIESVDMVDPKRSKGGDSYGNHATMMAGLVLQQAPQVQLVSVRTLDRRERGKWSEFLRGVHWITNHHQDGQPAVANLSLGGEPEPRIEEMVTKAIDDLVADGVTVVVAAGNDGKDVPHRIPSTLESVISVGAVSLFNYRLRDSNYGSCVDVYGPGENLKGPGSRSPKKRIRESGTSAAAAVVAGHVANYLGENPDATPVEVKQWVFENSEMGKVKNLPKSMTEEEKSKTRLFKGSLRQETD